MCRSRTRWGTLGALAVVVLSGCSSAAGACAGVSAQLPKTAVAGTTLTVHVSHLLATCPDTGGGSPQPSRTVTVDAAWAADPERAVASGSADVSDQATADVELRLPSGTSGVLLVRVAHQTLGQVFVSQE